MPKILTAKCPNCGSTDTTPLGRDKKGFSVGKMVGGAVLAGGVGSLAGFIGKKGKYQFACGNCGAIFSPKKMPRSDRIPNISKTSITQIPSTPKSYKPKPRTQKNAIPFYKTWWFWLIIGLFVLGLIVKILQANGVLPESPKR